MKAGEGMRATGRGVALAAAALIAALGLPAAAQVQNVTYNEFKIGVMDHDTSLIGGREKGADINPEILFGTWVDDAWAATVPGYLRWMVQPRLTIGGQINTAGQTDQAYIGATWSWRLWSGIFNPDDGIVVGYFFGPGFNDGHINDSDPSRKALGSHVLFREALDVGYQINPTYEVSAFIDHISNGGFAKFNQGMNDIGVRLGVRF